MGEVVNLRKWRKAREKAEAEAQAAANRAAFGRNKAEKQRDAKEAAQREARRLAAKNPGITFSIFQQVGERLVPAVPDRDGDSA